MSVVKVDVKGFLTHYSVMTGDSKKLLAAGLFTFVLILIVNIAWWLFYSRTEQILDEQLSKRLISIVKTAAFTIEPEKTERLLNGDFEAYADIYATLDRIRINDSLSEVFILDANDNYELTTLLENDSTYFLSSLNGVYIDSLFFGATDKAIASATYQTGEIYLKSAFAPVFNSDGLVTSVLGVEANVDYFDSLSDFKHNLFYASLLSLLGGLILGIIFIIIQRRINRLQRHLFLNETQTYLGRMVSIVSHEIKNPLMIIRASAERLRKKENSIESNFIIEETDRLNEIVSGYLNFAQSGSSGSGKATLITSGSAEDINLSEMITNLKKHLQENFPNDNINWIESKISPDISFTTYKRALRQVLINLLINSVEACKSAGREIKVGVETDQTNDKVIIKIIDYGPGIPKAVLKHIFEPFYSTKISGTGLGLYLCKKIIEEMNGKIVIKSQSGEKTVAAITLPKKPIE
ncbi:MAG: HAMP domain-containing sensor histidine kinase [bacterium]